MASNQRKFVHGIVIIPDSAPATGGEDGELSYRDSDDRVILSYNSVTGQVVVDNATQTLSNKTISAGTFTGIQTINGAVTVNNSVTVTGNLAVSGASDFDGALNLKQIATPSNPAAGRDKIYVKSDDTLYRLNSSGIEVAIGTGSDTTGGLLTVDLSASGRALSAGYTLLYPDLTIKTTDTFTISGTLIGVDDITVSGTLVVAGTGVTKLINTGVSLGSGAYDSVVGSASHLAAGLATYTSLTAAISAASAGYRILLLNTTITENITLDKQLTLEGKGRSSYVNGTLTATSAADFSLIRSMKFGDNITINAGASGIYITESWLADGKIVTDNGTSNFVLMIQE